MSSVRSVSSLGKGQGLVVDATVLTDITQEMKVSGCEVFEPVVTVMSYRMFDEVLGALNNSDFGLQAGVFTNDVKKIFQSDQAPMSAPCSPIKFPPSVPSICPMAE